MIMTVDDQIELDCGSDPYDPNDTPVFNSNGNCAQNQKD